MDETLAGDSSQLRHREIGGVLTGLSSNPYARDIAFDYVRQNFGAYSKLWVTYIYLVSQINIICLLYLSGSYTGQKNSLSRVLKPLLKDRNTEFEVDEVKNDTCLSKIRGNFQHWFFPK